MMKSSSVALIRFSLSRLWSRLFALVVVASCALHAPYCLSATVSFDTSLWDHGNGPQLGWNNAEFSGTTTVFGNNMLTISTTPVGNAVFTRNHFRRINQSYFSGFAFQLDPETTTNSTAIENYARMDFSFEQGVSLDSFVLTDVDRANFSWYDVIVAEGFTTSAPGPVGSGIEPNYSFESPTNLTTADIFGLQGAMPVPSSGNVPNTPDSDVTFNFSQGVRSFSIYYMNQNSRDDLARTQTIGIRGNEFTISSQSVVPESGSLLLVLVGVCGLFAMFRAGFAA